jgi:hypothetical protein
MVSAGDMRAENAAGNNITIKVIITVATIATAHQPQQRDAGTASSI